MKKKKNNPLIPILFILIFSIVLVYTIRKFTLASDINISSQIYNLNTNTITNISPNTSIEIFKKYFDLENCTLKIKNANNEEITTGFISTGSITEVYSNNTIIKTYTNIIKGDITNDGVVSEDDKNKLNQYLDNTISLSEIELAAIDINIDAQVTAEDLNRLTELMQANYTSLTLNKEEIRLMQGQKERIIPTINPNIILNQNLNWTSSNTNVATVNEAGQVTALQDGETTITASTSNNQISKTVTVIVDNKPKFDREKITAYSGGDDVTVPISLPNYNGLSCRIDNTTVATCRIDNHNLIITPSDSGETTAYVTSTTYGESSIPLEVLYTSFTMFPKEACLEANANIAGSIIVSGFAFGNISTKSISDREIVKRATLYRRSISIETGNKAGDARIVFTESNGHNEVGFTAKVFKLDISAKTGTTPLNGKKLVTLLTAQNTGDLSCTSDNTRIATCKIDGEYLTVTPVDVGSSTITITGSSCGSISYTATITERKNEDNYLSSLSIEGISLSPKFNKETLNYEAVTEKDKILIKATKSDETATMTGDVGERQLSYGSNIFNIKVVNELGETRNYNITVTRPLPKEQPTSNSTKPTPKNNTDDASVADIIIKNNDIDFKQDVYKYEIDVDGNTKELDLKVVPSSKNSKVEIEGADNLQEGNNTVTITITSESGTKCKYIVLVNKKPLSKDTSIKKIIIKNYDFEIKNKIYEYNLVIYKEKKLDIDVILNDKKATYKIEGNNKLKNGSQITITVTSEAGTTKDYIITIYKTEKSNNKLLSNIPLTTIIASILIITSSITFIIKRILKKQ